MRGSYFIIIVVVASLFFGANSAFADHVEVTIVPAAGSGAPGCEQTSSGCFIPSTATVDVGGVVIFSNTDSAAHTFTSSNGDNVANGIFDTGLLMSGNSFTYVPNTGGNINYFCMVHPWMQGLIMVASAPEEPEVIPTISISTNRASYEDGDAGVFSGKITNYDSSSGKGLTFIIVSPDNNIMSIGQLIPSYDGSFSKSFVVGGSLWELDGNYVIEVHYGIASDQTIFYYSTPEPVQTSIVVTTNKASYLEGETIRITGEVSQLLGGYALSLTVIAPNGDLVSIDQLTVGYDKKFGISLAAGGALMKSEGTYTVTAQYGDNKNNFATTSFEFGGSTPTPTYPNPAPYGTDVVIPRGTGSPGCDETRSCYDPYRITVGKYSTITWYNADSAAHTVTSGSPSNGPDGVFDSGMFMSGESFSQKFSRDGSFNYFCMLHPWMLGQVIVERGGIINEPTPTYPSPTRDTTPPKILKPTDITVDAENGNGARVSYDVLVIDETDQIVRPSCSPSSGSLFEIGETRVICNARDSAGNRATPISFYVTVTPPDVAIPDWIKNVAEFWCEDKIDNSSFIEGIQYLIDNNIIIVSVSSGYGGSQEIPNWVKNNACWWSQGLISSNDFASGIEFLVREGIIRV